LCKDLLTVLDGSPTCFRFALLLQRKPVTPPAKTLKHEGHESRDSPPAPDSDVDSLSDFSGDGDAIKLEEAPMHALQVESSAEEDIELYHSIQVVQALLSSVCDDDRSSTQTVWQNTPDGQSSLEDNRAERVAVPSCSCHGLLKRPISASLEPGTILKICRLYSLQMRNTRQTILRRLQDIFEILWQKLREVVPSLPHQVQQTLDLILDTPPTITDGLLTLSLLSAGKPPPSLHGYISLAFFAKAWLSLHEKQGLADVTYELFFETAHCATVMAFSNAERDAYDILLQLLWRPVAATMSPPETHPLFCPVPSQMKATSVVDPKWVLSHICRDIVDGKINTTA
jgi:hypothetical protein